MDKLFNKKGQAWSVDLLIGVFLFSVALSVFYFFTLNTINGEDEILEMLSFEGREITNSLLFEGFPVSWNSSNVVHIGILTNGKINESKLEAFYDLNTADYEQTKILFNSKYDYYFFLGTNLSINGSLVDGIGKFGFTRDSFSNNTAIKNLIKLNRITIYNDKPIGATLYVWETR